MNKLSCAGVLTIASIAFSGNVLAEDSVLLDGSGNFVSSSFEKCVIVSSGPLMSECLPKVEEVAQPAPEPTPAPKVVALPAPAPEPKPAPEPVRVQKAVTMAGDALFETNSAELSAEGQTALDTFVSDLDATADLQISKINVIGHADSRGKDSYNQSLSERRAQTVGNYLLSKGIDSSLISTSGRGESEPIASNATAEGRAQNRRVEIGLSGTQIVTLR